VWTYFEIDPHVVHIARDPTLFRFLSTCGADMQIVLGDAGLTLTASPQRYDLVVLDAFSSDAIPVHLLAREAFAGYLSRPTERGVIVLHISNRHMALWRPAVLRVSSPTAKVSFPQTRAKASGWSPRISSAPFSTGSCGAD
jgi:spermidine synthase